jgi:hypothetical protein
MLRFLVHWQRLFRRGVAKAPPEEKTLKDYGISTPGSLL